MCENCLINQISLGLSEQKQSSTDFKDIEFVSFSEMGKKSCGQPDKRLLFITLITNNRLMKVIYPAGNIFQQHSLSYLHKGPMTLIL